MSQIKNSLRDFRSSVAPAIAMGLTGSTITLVLPAVFAESLPDSNMVNRLVAVEMLGATVATTCLPPFLCSINRRLVAIIACIAVLSLDIVSLHTGLEIPLQLVRCAAGFVEGTVLAVSVACVASSKAPERNLALFVAINLSTATIILKLLRGAVAVASHQGPFLLFVALAALSTLAALAIPGRDKVSIDLLPPMARADARPGAARWAVTVGLVAFVALAAGAGSVWPSMVRFASAIDIPAAAVMRILGDATLAGIAGALLAAWLGTICTRQTIVTLGTGAMLGSVIALDRVNHAPGFTCCAMIFMASWMFLVPSYMGILAAADPAGRAAAFSLATQYGGLALGASLANLLVRNDETHAILLLGGLLFGVALAMVICADHITSANAPISKRALTFR